MLRLELENERSRVAMLTTALDDAKVLPLLFAVGAYVPNPPLCWVRGPLTRFAPSLALVPLERALLDFSCRLGPIS